MCLPPDVSTAAPSPIGRRRDGNANTWVADQRASNNWDSPPAQAGSPWTSWVDLYNLQQAGYPKDDACGIDAAPLGSLLASALAQQDLPKTWQPQPNWAAPQFSSSVCGPQVPYGGGIDAALLQSAQCTASDMGVTTPSNPLMSCQEPQALIAPRVVESLEMPKEEDKSQAGSWAHEFMQEARSEQDTGAKKFVAPKAAKTTCQKPKQATRPGVKKETATGQKDSCMIDMLSDMEGSDDDAEGAPVISEKRRKRMLSNRASAQRSRQRRQERLDTLEVLVAQLRVENAALTRKANNAVVSVKKLEDENKVLRQRLDAKEHDRGGQKQSAFHEGSGGDSLQTTCNTPVSVVEGEYSGKAPDGPTVAVTSQQGDSSSSENSDPNKRDVEQSINNNNANCNNTRATTNAKKSKRNCEDALGKDWSYSSGFTSVFSGEGVETTAKSRGKSSKPKQLPCSAITPEYAQVFEAMKGLPLNVPQTPAYQELDAFDIDLERSPDIDKKLLDSVEEIWLEGFSDCCFK